MDREDQDDVLLVVKTTFWEPNRSPLVQVVRVPLIDGRVVELDLSIDLRTVDRLEVKPVRRPLVDVHGHIRDAERLANETGHEHEAAA